MKVRSPLSKIAAWICLVGTLIGASACGTLQVQVEMPSEPGSAGESATATVAALMLQNTRLETQVASLTTAGANLTTASDSESIRMRLLNSHTYWKTVWVDGEVSWFQSSGERQVSRFQIWADPWNGRFKILSGSTGDIAPETEQVSDGDSILNLDAKSGQAQTGRAQAAAKQTFDAPQAISDTIYPHPLAQEMNTPATDALFPTGLAQRGGTYTPVGTETIAGRSVVVVDWTRQNSAVRIDRFWVDAKTGLILRWQNFDKDGEGLSSEMVFHKVEYDRFIPSVLFSTQPGALPRYAADATGTTLDLSAATQPASTTSIPADRSGEVYFVINSSQGSGLQLVRLSGECLVSNTPCPQPETVSGYPNQNAAIVPLYWSTDGITAVLPYNPADPGTAVLYRYRPGTAEWKPLVEFQSINEPIYWSPDGRYVALTAVREGSEDVFLVDMDGSFENVTRDSHTGSGDRYFRIVGWTGGQVIFGISQKNGASVFYSTFPGSGKVQELTADLPALSWMAISPDQQSIVYSDTSQSDEAVIGAAGTDGSNARRLASFKESSIGFLSWAPDGQWVAFSVSSGRDINFRTTVYVIRPDGTDLRQVFQANDLMTAVFSPDSSTLAFTASRGAALQLYVAPVDTGASRLIQAPGIRLDDTIQGLSWRR
jgi:Tol biopolymer transport system component/outer membrane lipoprotein-sorting protein